MHFYQLCRSGGRWYIPNSWYLGQPRHKQIRLKWTEAVPPSLPFCSFLSPWRLEPSGRRPFVGPVRFGCAMPSSMTLGWQIVFLPSRQRTNEMDTKETKREQEKRQPETWRGVKSEWVSEEGGRGHWMGVKGLWTVMPFVSTRSSQRTDKTDRWAL